MASVEQDGETFRVRLKGDTEVFILTKDQLPKIFDLVPLLDDFRVLVQQVGVETAKKQFEILLRKQLLTLIQEQVSMPLSPRMVYKVVENEKGIYVFDQDYPIAPDIISRSQQIVDIFEKKLQADPDNNVLQLFRDRFLVELQQVVKLVEILRNDPLFSFPLIQELLHFTQRNIRIQGKSRVCIVSNWYALVMPATEVHEGNKSYFNIYRIVFDVQSQQYFVETQGYLHGLSRKTQTHKLLNIDQEETFTSLDEKEMMLHIIQLSEAKNEFDPESLLIKIGVDAGDWLLPFRVLRARRRQFKQLNDIDESVEAILNIFEKEVEVYDTYQAERLEYFFEAIANPLLFQKKVFGAEIIDAYHTARRTGGKIHRESFLGSLLNVIPSLAWKAGGWSLCGGLSAGGIFTPGQAIQAAHGFGGIPQFDTCLTCPSCGALSNNGNTCSHCGFKRGELIAHHFPAIQKQGNIETSPIAGTVPQSTQTTFIDWFRPKETVGVMGGLLGFKETVSVSQGLLSLS